MEQKAFPHKPIFVIGLGRSGSSIFHKMFATHPEVAWLSAICDQYPDKPHINRLILNGLDMPLIHNYIRRKYAPAECYNFWEYYCRGFRTPCRDLVAEDLMEKPKREIQKALSETMTKKRQRLMLKITGWPRMGYLQAIFDDAIFIHVKRDFRAVANSFLDVPWWWGWRGPSNWRWGELPEKYNELWQKYDRSYVALAGIACLIFQDAMNLSRENNIKTYLEIDYEDLCDKPIDIFKEVVKFCDLEWSGEFQDNLDSFKLKNSNYKWRENLTVEQQNILEEVLTFT